MVILLPYPISHAFIYTRDINRTNYAVIEYAMLILTHLPQKYNYCSIDINIFKSKLCKII